MQGRIGDKVGIIKEMSKSTAEFNYTNQEDLLFNIVKTVLENVELLLEKKGVCNCWVWFCTNNENSS